MKSFPIPVRTLGPGSQASEEDGLHVLQMDRDVGTFAMPSLPESADDADMAGARDLLAAFHQRLCAQLHGAPRAGLPEGPWAESPARQRTGSHGSLRTQSPEGPRDWCDGDWPELDLTRVASGPLAMANQMLGEGEVSILIRGPREVRIQETIFAGLWRLLDHDEAGRVVGDHLLAAPIPAVVVQAARRAASPRLRQPEIPCGAMNSPALLREIQQHVAARRGGAEAHVVNLTLLPLTPDDHDVLGRAIEPGPVAIVSRGFGSCRVASTAVRDVWRVQYFNSMQTLILDTLEVVDVPEVALAAPEDLADSKERLGELVQWMSESCARQAGAS
jgi:hydrogenase-1 operon protein HyaF